MTEFVDFGEYPDTAYRYRVEVDVGPEITGDVVQMWAQGCDISCSVSGYKKWPIGHTICAYFHNEKDAMLFLLRWAT